MLGVIFKAAFSAVIGWIVKGLVYLGVYEAGKKAQASADDKATLKSAEDANAIRNQVSGESDSQLNDDLGNFVRGSKPNK